MQRRIDSRRRGSIWVERIAWNAVAAATLGVMIVMLLCSLQWLDRIDLGADRCGRVLGGPASSRVDGHSTTSVDDAPTRVARVNRPSG